MGTESRMKFPTHIGIIMDGNGRWAKNRGLARSAGHLEGAKALQDIISYAEKTEIKFLTFYTFSTENWKRPTQEISSIMSLFENYLDKLITNKEKHDVIIKFIGDKSKFSDKIIKKMDKCEKITSINKKLTVLIAVNYGGREEILNAVKKISNDVKENLIDIDNINEKVFEKYLYTNEIPDPDLIIRPSGELRISNFLMWQSAYSEFWFDDVLWPDFKPKDLDRAIDCYIKRERRFGGI